MTRICILPIHTRERYIWCALNLNFRSSIKTESFQVFPVLHFESSWTRWTAREIGNVHACVAMLLSNLERERGDRIAGVAFHVSSSPSFCHPSSRNRDNFAATAEECDTGSSWRWSRLKRSYAKYGSRFRITIYVSRFLLFRSH